MELQYINAAELNSSDKGRKGHFLNEEISQHKAKTEKETLRGSKHVTAVAVNTQHMTADLKMKSVIPAHKQDTLPVLAGQEKSLVKANMWKQSSSAAALLLVFLCFNSMKWSRQQKTQT